MNKTQTLVNVEAIQLLKSLQQNPRKLKETEQQTLRSFLGWGSIHQIFNDNAPQWAKEARSQLQEILTKEEYRAAQNATINAHYTDPKIVKAIWEGVQALGFSGGMGFEPGCGHGNFIGNQPPQLAAATQWFGVEKDPIAAGIAQALYPEATIYNQDFRNLVLPEGQFDLVIGNVPFFGSPVRDPKYANILSYLTDDGEDENPNLHCYFAMKGLMLLKEGGLLCIITSTGLLDAKGNYAVRRFLSQNAELVGALRLPDTAFKEYAGTKVTTDLIVLRRTAKKKQADYWTESVVPNEAPVSDKTSDPDWMLCPEAAIAKGNFGEIAHLHINSYYLEHPENILGTPSLCQLYGGDRPAVKGDGRDLVTAIERGIYGFGVKVDPNFSFSPGKAKERVIFIPPHLQGVPCFQFVEWNGAYYERLETTLKPVDEKHTDRIAAMIELYAALDAVIQAQQSTNEEILSASRVHLNETYDAFIEAYGYLNQGNNPKVLGTDPRYYLLMSLEVPCKENLYSFKSLLKSKSHFTKAEIFRKRTARANTAPDYAASEKEALLYSLNEKGKIDMTYIAQLMLPRYSLDGEICLEEAEQKAIAALTESDSPLVFFDPASEEWVTADEYLSGDVRKKLAIARQKQYEVNITALEAVQPKFILSPNSSRTTKNVRAEVALAMGEDLCEEDIDVAFQVRLATTWIPTIYKERFANELLGCHGEIKVVFAKEASLYKVDCNDGRVLRSTINCVTWGATSGNKGYTALELIQAGLNLKDTTVRVEVKTLNSTKTVVDSTMTASARKQLEAIENEFAEWLWSDVERAIALTEMYNEKFNCFVLRKYDGSHITLPGANPEIFNKLYPHQRNVIWRASQQRSVLFHHPVGAGKTFEMIASIMEAKRLGLAYKPMMVVLKSTVDQIASAFKYLYPTANILVADKKSYEAKNRKRFMTQIATGNWDCVIVTYPQFLSGISISAEAIEDWFDTELNALDAALKAAEKDGNKVNVKMLGAARTRLEAIKDKKVGDLLRKQDGVILWEQLGVDLLCCDESHLVKNLWYSTKMQGVAGLPNPASTRALDCYLKVQSLLRRGGRVIFGTATPISNSMVELWTVLRFLANDFLIEMGLDHFDHFASAFGQMVTGGEVTATGYKVKKRFSKFFNVAELVKIYTLFADVIPEWKLGIEKPDNEGPIVIEAEMTEAQRAYQYHLYERAMEVDGGNPRVLGYKRDKDGNEKAIEDNKLVITNNGRHANLDIRLVSKDGKNFSDSKLNRAAIAIYLIWKVSSPMKGTQLVFCDFSTPNSDKFNAYHYLKSALVALGIPEAEVQFIQSFKTDSQKGEAAKRQLFEDVNNGVVRVLLGGTETLGTGVNVQRRAVACHHLDVPYRPSDVTQRVGRVQRTGNLCPAVLELRYVTKGFKQFPGFDAYMWGMIERKQAGFSDVIYDPEKTANRTMLDIDPFVASAQLLKAMSTGDERYMELEDINAEISDLKLQKRGYDARHYQLSKDYKNSLAIIKELEEDVLPVLQADMESALSFPKGIPYAVIRGCEDPNNTEKLEEAYRKRRKEVKVAAELEQQPVKEEIIGEIAGFSLVVLVHWHKTRESDVYVDLYRNSKRFRYRVNQDTYKFFLRDKDALIDAIQTYIDNAQKQLSEAYLNLKQSEKGIEPWADQARLDTLEARKAILEEELGMTVNQEIEDDMGVKETCLKAPKSKVDSVDTEALEDSSMFDTPDCAPFQEIEPEMVELLREKLEDYDPSWLPKLQAIVSDVLAREATGNTATTLIDVPLVYGQMKFKACSEQELQEQEDWLEEFMASLSEPVVPTVSFETDREATDYFNQEEDDDSQPLYDVMQSPSDDLPAPSVEVAKAIEDFSDEDWDAYYVEIP